MLTVFYTFKSKRGGYCKPYKYLIQKNGTAYLAFEHTHAFKRWLRERGLKLVKSGKQYAFIKGEFTKQYTSPDDFKKIEGAIDTMVLNNGNYVPCKIKDGIEYVYHKGYIDNDYFDHNKIEQRIHEYRRLSKIYG